MGQPTANVAPKRAGKLVPSSSSSSSSPPQSHSGAAGSGGDGSGRFKRRRASGSFGGYSTRSFDAAAPTWGIEKLRK
jgi:hypothetical protein